MKQLSHLLQCITPNLTVILLGLFFILGSDGDYPVITVLGDNPATVKLGDIYTDKGAIAADKKDGKVDVITIGLDAIDTSIAKNYSVTYTAIDSDKNTTIATRLVKVIKEIITIEVPKNIKASASDQQITLTWDEVADANKYTVYMAEETGIIPENYSVYIGGTMLDNKTSPLALKGLKNGKTYYFVVTASKLEMESKASNEISATPNELEKPKTCIINSIDDYHYIGNGSIEYIAGTSWGNEGVSWDILERQDLLVGDKLNCLKMLDITDISFIKAKYSNLADIESFREYPDRDPTNALIVSINFMSTADFKRTTASGFSVNIYIDEDNNYNTGYKIGKIGAEAKLRSSYGFYPSQYDYSRFNKFSGLFEKYFNNNKYVSDYRNYDRIGLDHDTLYIGEVAKIMPTEGSYAGIATVSRTDMGGNNTNLIEQTNVFTINPFINNY